MIRGHATVFLGLETTCIDSIPGGSVCEKEGFTTPETRI